MIDIILFIVAGMLIIFGLKNIIKDAIEETRR